MMVEAMVGVALITGAILAPSTPIEFKTRVKERTPISSSLSSSSYSLPYSVESLVLKYFSKYGEEVVQQALLCVHLESRGDTNAVSKDGKYVGLWQMDSRWGTHEQRVNPEWSTAAAAKSYAKSGWKAWPPIAKKIHH